MMSDITIVYATISGRTRKIATEFAGSFSPCPVQTIDLRDGIDSLNDCRLMVFGSPTYGVGEWHYLWEKYSPQFARFNVDWANQCVAIFALGDVKHHPKTFAGAITQLKNFVLSLDAKLVGSVPFDDTYSLEHSKPLLHDNVFPGLVLDQVKQRKLSMKRIEFWVNHLKKDVGLIS